MNEIKFCEKCGSKLVKRVTHSTYNPYDGHKINWYDLVCPRGGLFTIGHTGQ